MKNQFVTYEIALKLKELGFDEFCFAHYCNGDLITKTAILKSSTMQYYQQNNINPSNQYKDQKCTAPLWQQAIDWLREKYNIHIYIDFYDGLYGFAIKLNKEKLYNRCGSFEPGFKNYPEAREQAILKCIELLKNK